MESPREECESQGLRDLRTSAILHCDKEFIDLLMVTQHEVPQASQHLRGLFDEFQKVQEIALQVVEKNAYLEGRVRELAKVKPAETRTFADVTRTNLANKGRDGENRSTPSERKAVLLVRAPEDEEETSSGEVPEKLTYANIEGVSTKPRNNQSTFILKFGHKAQPQAIKCDRPHKAWLSSTQ
ncbi:hypothetical protein HPB51_022311 [Rhipicephalus microplus]|uniref:Uncharacterized protein n=1 Tax=Rhipicephalus microplus TaxID=6941 RepID=A0A9J6DWP5_RHIMP|nr:hypothetical protein HPB51_022311 [Rhipicephalus microplus]